MVVMSRCWEIEDGAAPPDDGAAAPRRQQQPAHENETQPLLSLSRRQQNDDTAEEEQPSTLPGEESSLASLRCCYGTTEVCKDDDCSRATASTDITDDDDQRNAALASVADVIQGVSDATGAVVVGLGEIAGVVLDSSQGVGENVVEGMQEMAENVAEAVLEEVAEVREVLLDELHEADEGETYFLEMGLSRGLSILPNEVTKIAETGAPLELANPVASEPLERAADEEEAIFPDKGGETADQEQIVSVPEDVKYSSTPLKAYLLLIGAVISLSSVGPSLALQQNVEAPLKLCWRMTGTALMLLPFAVRSILKEGFPRLTSAQWITFVFAVFGYVTTTLAFVVALDYTTVGNAVIFSNSQSLLLLAGKALSGSPILPLEGLGAVTAFAGAILCSSDSSSKLQSEPSSTSWIVVGDLLSLLSAFGGVFYLTFGKAVRGHMSVFVFMFFIMTGGALLVLTYMTIMGEEFSFSRHVDHGLFGWTNFQANRLPLEMYMVVVCNLLGAMGYVRAMQYFDNIVIAVATLMEPVTASLIACFVGVGLLPGLPGWIGNILVVCGTLAVVHPSSSSAEKKMEH